MNKFGGGSAFSFARDIAEGYFLITERSFKGMSEGEINQLAHEMDRHLRELRGASTVKDENTLVQARNRKIQRLASAMTVLRNAQRVRR